MKSLINKIKCIKKEDISRITFTALPFVLAFFIPFILAIILFSKHGYYPFSADGHSLAMVDLRGQYIAFFRYYKTILDGDNTILYTLGKVTGGDFLSIFTYYLASPFNLVLKFVANVELPKALMWLVIIKIALSGLTAYISLAAINKNGFVNLIFSIAYALMAYNFVYYSNIMWLDGVLALPLVALAIHLLTQEKSALLYIFALAYVIATSWYIGIMVAMFSVFFFLYNFISLNSRMYFRKKLLLTFTLSSLLAGLISFAFWGSALVNILGTKGSMSFTNLSKRIKEFYALVDIERGFLYGNHIGMKDIMEPTSVIYAGALPLFLMIMFFANRAFSRKQRIAALTLVLIYVVALFNKGVDHLFHGGPAPNWFPCRYGFIFSFIVIYFASLNFREYKATKWYAFIAPVIVYLFLIISLTKNEFAYDKKSILYFSITFCVLVIFFVLNEFIFKQKGEEDNSKRVQKYVTASVSFLLIIVSAINVFGNSNRILSVFSDTVYHESMTAYRNDERIGRAIDFLKKSDNSLYRLEKSFIRSGTYNNANNDSMYFNYNGISHYSSSEKKQVMDYMRKIGFHYNGFNLNYANGSTLAINSYLGVKYLLDNGVNRNFDFVRELPLVDDGLNDDINTYLNTYALPFLMPIEDTNISYVGDGVYVDGGSSVYWFDMFEYQNHLFKTITRTVKDELGKPKDIFKKATYTKTLSNVTPLPRDYYYKVVSSGTIDYDITLDKNTNYYYYIHGPKSNDLALYDRNIYTTYFSYHGYQINGIRRNTASTRLSVAITKPQESIKLQEAIYYEDLSVLNEYINAIKAIAEVDIKQEKTSKYSASVVTKKDNQYMLLTLPYNQNLRVFIDGKKVETTTRFNIFTGFTIPKAGAHKITIKYVELTYQLGIPVGILSAAGTIVISVLNKKKKEEQEKA